MAEMDLTLVIRSVMSPQARAALAQLQTSNVSMVRGTNALATSADRAAKAVGGIGRQGKFSSDVLQAFVLYRGFVVLQEGAMAATRALVELEHEVAIVQTQLNEMGKDFQPLIKQRVIDTAQKTGLAFADLAKAEFEIVSANIAVADSFAILEMSAKAAAAGGIENVELAFNAALSQINAFGLGVDQFDEVFDKQFNLVKRGIFTYEQFATIVGSVSEAFASMGQDVETANAALAAISQVFTGKQIERGATGLRNAVLAISEAPEKFEELGIRVTDAAGDFRNFIDIGRDLKVVLDGMSDLARAQVIKDIFPDERERRGINAFLGQLDQAEQFMVEQKFAAGDLEDAFQTVNEVLHDQANIMKGDVIPAFDPFLDVISGLVSGFNEMNDIMPGFTKGLVQAALAVAAIQATMAFGPGAASGIGGMLAKNRVFSGSRIPQTTMVPGMEGGFNPVTSTSFRFNRRAALISGAAGGAFGGGAGSFAGAAGMGAMAGSIGGIGGAGIGAAVGLLAHGLGVAMKKEGDNPARSFAVAFSDELNSRSGDIAGALTAALAESAMGENVTSISAFNRLAASGRVLGERESLVGAPSDVAFGSRGADEMRAIFKAGGEVFVDGKLVKTLEDLDREIASSRAISVEARRSIALEGTPTASVEAGIAAREAVLARESEIRADAKRFGVNEDEAVADAIRIAVEKGATEGAFGSDIIASFTQDFLKAVDFAPTAEQMAGFEKAVAGGSTGLTDFIKSLAEIPEELKSAFALASIEFNAIVKGNVSPAVEVFERMGEEGENLAEVFKRIASSVEAFSLLKTLEEITFNRPGEKIESDVLTKDIGIPGFKGFTAGMDITPGMAEFFKSIGLGGSVGTKTTTVGGGSSNMLESLGIDPVLAAELITDKMLADIGLVRGEFTTAEFVEAMYGEDGAPELQLGTTALADSLFEAAELVRGGFLDGLGFSADNLEMFGEEMESLNKLVRQRAILEELKNLAEFVDPGGDRSVFEEAMGLLREKMVAGGESFFEIMNDPVKLAALLDSMMEMGDINLDQSTQNNFVIRVSGDVSPAQIAALQAGLTDWQNTQTREASAR